MKGSRGMETIIFSLLFFICSNDSVFALKIHTHSFICKNKRRKLKVISQLKKSLHCDFFLAAYIFFREK
jgi:hypothetical protein